MYIELNCFLECAIQYLAEQ